MTACFQKKEDVTGEYSCILKKDDIYREFFNRSMWDGKSLSIRKKNLYMLKGKKSRIFQ